MESGSSTKLTPQEFQVTVKALRRYSANCKRWSAKYAQRGERDLAELWGRIGMVADNALNKIEEGEDGQIQS